MTIESPGSEPAHGPDRQEAIREFEKLAMLRSTVQAAYVASALVSTLFLTAVLLWLLFPALRGASGSQSLSSIIITLSVLPLRHIRRKIEPQYQEAKRRLES